jgi:hypothetical protein
MRQAAEGAGVASGDARASLLVGSLGVPTLAKI